MLFSEVTIENIKQAVNDINKEGIPNGFSNSKYYDVKIDGALYPPKPVMAIANYYATGTKIGNYFSGGMDTPCFKAYERLGIPIVEKSNSADVIDLYQIILSSNHQDELGNLLKAKLQVLENGYMLLKGSYLYKDSKPSFLDHPYKVLIDNYSNQNYVEETSFNEFQILKKNIVFTSPSAAASMVLKRAASGPNEWKTESGQTLREKENKVNFYKLIQEFLEQANTDSLRTKHYPKSYDELEIKVSFGVGNQARVPWIALLLPPNKVTDGVYPVYLFFKNVGKLVLAYGLSETNDPEVNWKLNNPESIKSYFNSNDLGKPDRYGSSYIYKVYDVDNLPDETTINEDIESLVFIYREQNNLLLSHTTNEKKMEPSKFKISSLIESIEKAGLHYFPSLIVRFTASLLTKPFVILTGLSGSGKTKLAQAFVQWICQDKSQYRIVPVGADWTNREPLLGYPNALDPDDYVKPDNGVIDLMMEAEQNPSKPYFLVLDEMNLSHVERYFADFLSVMESNEEIPLHDGVENKNGVPPKLKLPSNLFIIGTVNIDETTNMFSPKVLDRANTIEFRIDDREMESFLGSMKELNMKVLEYEGANMAEDFVNLSRNKSFETENVDEITSALLEFFRELKKTGAEFGYRTATEIMRLIHQISVLDSSLQTKDKIDIAIMQKLLPKLHGSRRKLSPILETLGGFCLVGEENIVKDIFEKDDYDFNNRAEVKYPLSLEKISRMYNGAIDNGFTSFAEA